LRSERRSLVGEGLWNAQNVLPSRPFVPLVTQVAQLKAREAVVHGETARRSTCTSLIDECD